MKKKKYTLPVIIALMLAFCAITVFAATATVEDKYVGDDTTFGLCDVSGCNTEEEHQHSNEHYSGHSVNDGHDYHFVCNADGCTEITEHEHQTVTSNSNVTSFGICNVSGCNTEEEHQHSNEHYSGHSVNDGHNYHFVCNVDGCTEITEHEHQSITSRNENTHHDSEYNRGEHH